MRRRRFWSASAAFARRPRIAGRLAHARAQAAPVRADHPHPDALGPAQLALLDHGIVALERDGTVGGWVATTTGRFWSPGRPTRTQTCVWLLFTWADGTRDRIEEDYPPYALVPELLAGGFSDPERGEFTARWLTGSERDAAWATHGIHDPSSGDR